MEFAAIHLLILGATAAVLIPVLIHLFNRTRFQVTDWAAMEFLLAALKKTRKRVQLENLLLLILRILVLLFAALMLSRPSIEGAMPLPKKTHLVIVLDNTYSMATRIRDQQALERAKVLIEGAIGREKLPDGSAVSLVRTSERLSDYSRATEVVAPTPTANGESPEIAASSPISATPIRSESDLRRELESVKQQLDTFKKALDQAQAELADARQADAARRASLQEAVRNARKLVEQTEAKLLELQRDLADHTRKATSLAGSATAGQLARSTLFTTDRENVRLKLRETTISAKEPDWLETWRLAAAALDATQNQFEDKRLVVVSDGQKRNFPSANDPQLGIVNQVLTEIAGKLSGPMRYIDLGSTSVANRAIIDAKLLDPVIGVGVPLQVTVTVANFSTDDSQNKFNVFYSIDGGRKRKFDLNFESVPPGKTATASGYIEAFDSKGTHSVELFLEDDMLALDNQFALVVDVRDALDLLVLDGQSNHKDGALTSKSEVWYFMVALPQVSEELANNPSMTADPSYKPKTMIRATRAKLEEPGDDLQGIDLYKYNVIVIANVRQMTDDLIVRLERYVRAGGAVVLTMGDNVEENLTWYNDKLWRGGQGLLPLKIFTGTDKAKQRDYKGTMRDKDNDVPLKIQPVVPLHRCIRDLVEQDATENTRHLIDPNIYQYIGFEWPSVPPAHIRRLVELNDTPSAGMPPPVLLYSARFGQGQVVVFTSSLDGRWGTKDVAVPGQPPRVVPGMGNTMPVYSSYIEFWQELMYAMAETPALHKQLRAGEPYRRPVAPEEFSQNNFVFVPGSNPAVLEQGLPVPVLNVARNERENTVRGELYFADTNWPGVYTVKILKERDTLRALLRELIDNEQDIPPTQRRPLAEELANVLMENKDPGTVAQANAVGEVLKKPVLKLPLTAVEPMVQRVMNAVAPVLKRDLRSVVDRFAVNLPTAESDLTRLGQTSADCAAALKTLFPQVPLEWFNANDPAETQKEPTVVPKQSRIWWYVGVALLVLLIGEMLLATFLTHRQK